MARAKKKAAQTAEEKLAAALVPEAEQPYQVPENWCWVRLDGITRLVSTTGRAVKLKEVLSSGTYPVISQGETSVEGYCDDADKVIDEGQLILFGDHTKVVKYIDEPFVVGADGVKLFQANKVDSKWLYYWLKYAAITIPARGYARHYSLLRGLPVPLPPLPEQRRIVERVESLFAKLDAAESKLRDILAQSETRRTAILHDAFSGKLTKAWRDEHGFSLSDWESSQLIDLCEKIFDGPFGSHLKSVDYIGSGIRVVRLENLRHLSFDDSKRSYVSKDKYATIQSHTVYPTDVLMSTFISDNVKVCQLPSHIEFAVNKADCIGIRPRPGVKATWLLYSLASNDTFLYLRSQIHGSTRPRVNSTQIKKIPLRVPPLPEQHKIACRLDALFAKQDAADACVNDALSAIATLRQTILARALRGELGTNDPTEENSLELLKTVL